MTISVPFDRFPRPVDLPDLRFAWTQYVAFSAAGALSAVLPGKNYLQLAGYAASSTKGPMLYNAHQARKAAHEKGLWSSRSRAIWIAIAMAGDGPLPMPSAPLRHRPYRGTAFRPCGGWRTRPTLCFDVRQGRAPGRKFPGPLDVAMATLPVGKSLRCCHGCHRARIRNGSCQRGWGAGHDAWGWIAALPA